MMGECSASRPGRYPLDKRLGGTWNGRGGKEESLWPCRHPPRSLITILSYVGSAKETILLGRWVPELVWTLWGGGNIIPL